MLLLFCLPGLCVAQTTTADSDDERTNGRYLLDLSYTQTDSEEGNNDVLAPGFTWLVSADIRVGASTSFMNVKPDECKAK